MKNNEPYVEYVVSIFFFFFFNNSPGLEFRRNIYESFTFCNEANLTVPCNRNIYRKTVNKEWSSRSLKKSNKKKVDLLC